MREGEGLRLKIHANVLLLRVVQTGLVSAIGMWVTWERGRAERRKRRRGTEVKEEGKIQATLKHKYASKRSSRYPYQLLGRVPYNNHAGQGLLGRGRVLGKGGRHATTHAWGQHDKSRECYTSDQETQGSLTVEML